MSAPIVLAHAGHWITGLIYAAPVILILAALLVTTMRERRRKHTATSVTPRGSDP